MDLDTLTIPATEIASGGPRLGHAFTNNVAAAPVITKQILSQLAARRLPVEAVRVVATPAFLSILLRVPGTDLYHVVEIERDNDDERGRPQYCAEVGPFSEGTEYEGTGLVEPIGEPITVSCQQLEWIGSPVAACLEDAYRILFKPALKMSEKRMRLKRDGWEYLGMWGFVRRGRRAHVRRDKTDYADVSARDVEMMREHYQDSISDFAFKCEQIGIAKPVSPIQVP